MSNVIASQARILPGEAISAHRLLRRRKQNRTTPRNDTRGFTLIELMLVAVILSIVIGLASPRFKNTFSEIELKNAAFNLYKLMHFAREKAILQKKSFKVTLNFDGSTYRLLEWKDKDLGETPDAAESAFFPVPGRFGRTQRLPSSLKLDGDSEEVACHADGNCSPAKLRVLDDADKGYEIAVSEAGSIKIKEVP